MSEITWFYIVNGASAVLLLSIGALGFFRSNRRSQLALSLFLAVWGAQLVLNNVAPNVPDIPSYGRDSAESLYLLGNLALPLQALLLLAYAHREAELHPRLRRIAKIAAYCCLTLAVIGFAFAVAGSPTVFEVTEQSGSYSQTLGNGSVILFQLPQLLGISIAVVLLALASKPDDKRQWHVLSGLVLAIGYSVGWAISYQTQRNDYDLTFLLRTLSMTSLALIVPAIMVARLRHQLQASTVKRGGLTDAWPYALAAVLLASCFASWPSGWLWFATAPGFARLASLAFFVAALRHAGLWQPIRATRAVPFVGAVVCNLTTAMLFALVATSVVSQSWTGIGAGLALAGMILTALFALPTAFNVLLPSRSTGPEGVPQ